MDKRPDVTVERVAETISRESLVTAGDRVLAAVSGGSDSLALLHILWTLSRKMGFELQVASLDHGLRGEAGPKDRDFVARMAGGLGLGFHGGQADARVLARETGLSLEDAARRVRYEFLAGVASDWGTGFSRRPRVALGHTADDQAETIVMRLLEGTGLDGLRGMPVRREEDGWVLIRPLLRLSRAEVRDYCRRWDLEPRHDETNNDLRFKRNLVRARLMPVLAQYNPRVCEALVRLAEVAGPELEALEEKATQAARGTVTGEVPSGESPFGGLKTCGRVVALARAGLSGLDLWVKRRLFRRILRELTAPEEGREIGLAGVDRTVEAAESMRVGGRLHLPGGVVFESGYKYVFLAVSSRECAQACDRSGDEYVLGVPGQTEVTGLGWTFSAEWYQGDERPAERGVLDLDPALISFPLKVRTRRPGEVFHPAGMKGTKTLKEFFISEKIPRAERGLWPLVVDADDRVVWVTALRADGRFVVLPESDHTLRLRAERRREVSTLDP